MTKSFQERENNQKFFMQTPLVSASGIWYAYFSPGTYLGDDNPQQVNLTGADSLGNGSLFSAVEGGVSLTHRALVNVDIHASCAHDVAIERTLAVQLDKGASGGLMERGQSKFVAGDGNAAYQGLLESGHIVRASVSAPGDQVEIIEGYISVKADPV